jgi:SAM-dependent methyltransferase
MELDDLLYKPHVELERQGPGSPEMTIKALSFLDDLDKISKVVDFGCGTGGQTMVLAQNVPGKITGVEIYPQFIDAFNLNAKKLNLQERVIGIVGSMDDISLPKEEFDLIWSEGAINYIGYEKALNYWNGFLKKNGYIAFTSPSWLTDERPVEVEKFWTHDGSCELETIGDRISIMLKAGYSFISAFILPDNCWTDNYFTPRETATKKHLEKHSGNKEVEDYIENDKHEVELYSKYSRHYGYVFYIGKKI